MAAVQPGSRWPLSSEYGMKRSATARPAIVIVQA